MNVDHLGTVLMATAAAVAMSFGQWLAGISGLLAAGASFACTRRLQARVNRANEQTCVLDAQLIQSQKLASIGELSSGIAHEINNPLAIIGQEVELVRYTLEAMHLDGGESVADVMDSLREIARQVERCREITHKLLDFARKKDPLIQSVDVNRLVEDMAKLVEKEAVLKGIKIVRQYCKDLPPAQTDPPFLRQIVLNLLNNATYAVDKNGTITIITSLSGSSGIDILVEDTGCGIPEEDLHKIFDPFFTTKPPGKGTGLGLSICHGIIERLGGRITVASQVGKGSVFTIHLPMETKKGAL